MAFFYSFERDGRLLHCRAKGRVSDRIITAFVTDLCRQPDLSHVEAILVRSQKIDELLAGQAGLRDAISIFEKHAPAFAKLRRYALVAQDDVEFGVARMYQQLAVSLPWDTEVFGDLTDARAWLDEAISPEVSRGQPPRTS